MEETKTITQHLNIGDNQLLILTIGYGSKLNTCKQADEFLNWYPAL